ncbi:transposase, MuDR, MULE transposase domain protein [Tanacetum coccineum]
MTSTFKFKLRLVFEASTRSVLLPKAINYKCLVRYCKKKFTIKETDKISLSYEDNSERIDVNDDDDLECFMNDVVYGNACVPKLFITLTKSFASYMRPLIKIDRAHLKGTYLGTNLLDVGMDTNNQIIPLAMGISQGEAVNMVLVYDELVPDFKKSISDIREVRPEAYRILEDTGFEKWSSAYGPANRYNYMTSNCAESINPLTKTIRKVPIMTLMDYYRDLIQRWYFERRYDGEDEPLADELSRWVAAKGKSENAKKCDVDCAQYRKVQGLPS